MSPSARPSPWLRSLPTSDDDDDDDDTTTTTTVTTGTATTQGGLPCVPVMKEQDGMTYYLCGQQHYVLAYGGAGPIYIPVPTPARRLRRLTNHRRNPAHPAEQKSNPGLWQLTPVRSFAFVIVAAERSSPLPTRNSGGGE